MLLLYRSSIRLNNNKKGIVTGKDQSSLFLKTNMFLVRTESNLLLLNEILSRKKNKEKTFFCFSLLSIIKKSQRHFSNIFSEIEKKLNDVE